MADTEATDDDMQRPSGRRETRKIDRAEKRRVHEAQSKARNVVRAKDEHSKAQGDKKDKKGKEKGPDKKRK